MHSEFLYLKKFFGLNRYNLDLFYKTQFKFLNSTLSHSSSSPTVPKQNVYLKLPFYDQIYFNLRRELHSYLDYHFPQLNLKLVFTNNSSIKSFTNHKERPPIGLRSGVVYKFSCGGCAATYIGSTVRQLSTPVAEHRGVSPRTNIPLTNPLSSSIRDHSISHKHNLNLEHFSILSSAKQPTDLRILESLQIRHHKPNLNSDSGPLPISILD